MKTLTIDSFNHSFNRKSVLQGVFLDIPCGSITGIFGANGCGKTTLFSCITDAIHRSSGSIFLNNSLVEEKIPATLIAHLPQVSFLPRQLTVTAASQLFLGKTASLTTEPYARDPWLRDLAKKKVRDLSGGERRYLECLLVLSLQRPFVLLDEPFAEIEPRLVEHLFTYIRALSPNTGFVITDHNHHAVRTITERLFVMISGQLLPCPNDDKALRALGYFPEI